VKAGISNIWLLGLIATFIFIFSCYIIISINYTKSFKMKNEMLTIIEKGKGMTGLNGMPTLSEVSSKIVSGERVKVNVPTFQTINYYLLGNAYDAMNYCPQEYNENTCWYGVTSLLEHKYEPAQQGKKYYYCFAKFAKGNNSEDLGNMYNRYYYKVRLFYKMELPVLDNWLAVKVDGKTAEINDVQDIDDGGGSKMVICQGK